MEKVPQIVSERLRAASSPVGHPDPDVLTAFSEQSLRKSERAAVLEHLARCGQCREIVALALPASDQLQETIRPARESWLTWPVLRWGFVVAGIIAIASFGVVQYQHRSANMVARQSSPSDPTSEQAKNLQPTPLPATLAENRDKATAPPTSIFTDQKGLSSPNAAHTPSAETATPALGGPVQAKRAASGGTLPHGPRVQWQQNTNQQQQLVQSGPAKQLPSTPLPGAPPSSPSSSPASIEVDSTAEVVSSNLDSSVAQNEINQQALQNCRADTKVERSKPAATTGAMAPQRLAGFPATNAPGKPQLIRPSAPATLGANISILWTITAVGKLQRSLDQGTTWQNIDVNNSSALGSAGAVSMTPPAKAKDVLADSAAKKEMSAPLTFRAVASNGADVWAGASGGFLYHSTDAGSHWTRVVPSASGASLTGDIVSLEFVDPQHGRVVTSIPEIWVTSDSGQSWQKQ